MLRTLLLFSCLLLAHSSLAIEITLTELDKYRAAMALRDRLPDDQLASVEQVGQLDALPEPLSLMIKAQWLTRLAGIERPSSEQRVWVKAQASHPQVLLAPLLEHPEKTIVVIDLQALATRTEILWRTRDEAALLQRLWDQAQLDWMALPGSVSRRGLLHWLSQLGDSEAPVVASHFETYGLSRFARDTELISTLALSSRSEPLFSVLWKLPADEHTHRTLQLIGREQSDTEASILIQAAQNPKLVSQGYMLLAKHHAHKPIAQRALLDGLQSERHRWQAAAAIRSVTDKQAKASLSKALSSSGLAQKSTPDNKARQWALAGLKEGALL